MKKTMNCKTIATLTALALGANSSIQAESVDSRISNLEKEIASLKSVNSEKQDSVMGDFATWASKTSIGGYGELHYNNFENQDDEIDFHRFVIFVNHEFTDKIRLVSEIELEHALSGDGKPGEVELEQAYIEMDLNNDLQVRAGLFLVPVGILNEIHEPPTFFGVERNRVENRIIPTTWWEAGLGATKKFDNGLTLDGAFTSGLNIGSNGSIRSGRGKVAEAAADSFAFTGRATYTGILGSKFTAFAQFNTDIVQDDSGSSPAALYGATFEYENNGFGLRALYAKWDIAGDIPTEAKDQSGFYIEPSYTHSFENNMKAGVFARYEEVDYYNSGKIEEEWVTVGMNFWPHENVVLKADYQIIDNGGDEDETQWNLGVGYQF